MIPTAQGQAPGPKASSGSGAIFGTVGGGNTQFFAYADNALGFNFGAFYQYKLFMGAEVRGGFYPISARYTQAPITLGYRIGTHSQEGESNLGWSPFSYKHSTPFAYIGGGFSYAQDQGYSDITPPVAPAWAPTWQASAGVDRAHQHFSWRMAEISWTKSYTPEHELRTPYLSTGIVFHFKH